MSAVLAVGAAVLAVAAYLVHIAWGPQSVVAVITTTWAVVAVPVAAYGAWRDERLARIAAEDAAATKVPVTVRPAVFDLAREIRAWLRDLPQSDDATSDARAVRDGFNARFRDRTLALWERVDLAGFPHNRLYGFEHYLTDERMNRETVRDLANDLEIFVNRVATDYPAE